MDIGNRVEAHKNTLCCASLHNTPPETYETILEFLLDHKKFFSSYLWLFDISLYEVDPRLSGDEFLGSSPTWDVNYSPIWNCHRTSSTMKIRSSQQIGKMWWISHPRRHSISFIVVQLWKVFDRANRKIRDEFLQSKTILFFGEFHRNFVNQKKVPSVIFYPFFPCLRNCSTCLAESFSKLK